MIINKFFILVCLSLVTSSLLVTKSTKGEKTNILNKPLLKKNSYGKTTYMLIIWITE